jgi:hypothetical protein
MNAGRALRVAVAGAAVGTAALLALAAPAWAHGGDAPDGTNFRTQVTGVSPTLPGVTVRAVEAGARLELTNHGQATVEVLGYDGEPYLEIRPDGVYQNTHSPATYLNLTLTGSTTVPPGTDPTAAPEWRRISSEPVARWHDHRAHWMESAPPPQVRADPGRVQRIRDWTVPLRIELATAEVHGTLDWIPPPLPGLWWALAVLGAAAVSALGLRPTSRLAEAAMGALAVAAGTLAIVYAVGRELDAGAKGLGAILLGMVSTQAWPLLTALGAIAAGVYALARRPAADFALALTGCCLALFGGVANAAVLARAVAPVPWPTVTARVVVAGLMAVGAGLVAANVLRMRAAAQAAAREATVRGPQAADSTVAADSEPSTATDPPPPV